MLSSKRFPSVVILSTVIFFLFSLKAFSQSGLSSKDTFDIKTKTFFLPNRTSNRDFRHMISVTRYFLPSDWTNIAVNAPMFNYTARYSLPMGFSIEGGISTLFVSNKFMLGPRWSYSRGNFHVGISYQYGYNLGFLNEWGFSTLVTSWSHLPGVSVGYNFRRSAITLRAGLEYIGDIYYKTGENVTTTSNFKLNGSNLAAILEQRLTKNHLMTFAFEIDHVNFVMLAWPAFPVNNKTYFVPQVTWGYTF
ncbi:hypothetical protein BH10BAC4_BH10BAC4_21790 [soil metagenome]